MKRPAIRMLVLASSLCAVVAPLLLNGPAVAASPERAAEEPRLAEEALPSFDVTFDAANGPVGFDDVQGFSTALGAELKAISFSGAAGMGELSVLETDTPETLEYEAEALFRSVNADVPPVIGATIEAARPLGGARVDVEGITATIVEAPEPALSQERTFPSNSSRLPGEELSVDTSPSSLSASVVNDWPRWFPSDWRAEGYNLNRCTHLSNGTCVGSQRVAALTQSVVWMDDHTPTAWPSPDWGLEFGVALYNYSRCPNSTTVNYGEKWWLNPDYVDWSTNLLESASPGAEIQEVYLDDNRWFDDCAVLTHEIGVRRPASLTAGYTYSFTVRAPRNTMSPDSSFSAAFQAVHDDCIGEWSNRSDCMGLWNTPWPYSGPQAVTVVNASRHLLFPNCHRMHDKWDAPLSWVNGGNRFMPAPLNYWDTCFYNDWN